MTRGKATGMSAATTGLKRAVVFSLMATLISGILLGWMLALLPNVPSQSDVSASSPDFGGLLAMTTATMFLAGTLGGCLYNLRGLIKHSAEDDYHVRYNLSYYLRPVSGGVSGVIVFFLLLGGAMTLNVGTPNAAAVWTTLSGRMPYVAFSLLAGYGSNEFMAKLKDLAESLFALKKNDGKP